MSALGIERLGIRCRYMLRSRDSPLKGRKLHSKPSGAMRLEVNERGSAKASPSRTRRHQGSYKLRSMMIIAINATAPMKSSSQ